MISILICSANPGDLLLVRKNIESTIGAIPYEIIAFDNSEGKKGISEVYNVGIKQARYELICFMHEDVSIKTKHWGNTIIRIFSGDPEIGIVGVAGGGYKSLAPSGWYCPEFENPAQSYQNILQGYKLDSKEEVHAYHNPYNEPLSDVVCVDGVWFCTRKSIALKNLFDEKLLKGFHGYDLDFCLNVFGKHRIVVSYDILMKHASEGNFNNAWLNEILKLHQKWNKYLPLTTSDVSEKEIYLTEKRAIKKLIEQMLGWNYPFAAIQKMLLNCTSSKRMPFRLFFKGYLHLVKQTWK
ncbi:glycosyltransferase [Dyadobacter sp. NIV53]|uniref:glycosyltransferase n=1 Tax=Dyadobacter sp. NIV53 TaxID=2861765 RepID=UPI001C886F82|nr:glycosyltransferase [Dyadobacter sp. NIV53]